MESEPTETPRPPAPEISRRDFIRRASREAVDTGTKLVPGASVARKVLGIDNAPTPPGGDAPKSLFQRFAVWRDRRRKESANDE